MKAKTISAAVFAAICWIALCLDRDILMYSTGFIALVLIGLEDLKISCRFTKFSSQRWMKSILKSGLYRSIRKEVSL